jgi:putative transposase
MKLIQRHRPETLSLSRACQLVELPRSTYYAQAEMPDKVFAQDEHVEAFCHRYSSYGYRRIKHQLQAEGYCIGTGAVRLAMQRLGLRAKKKRPSVRTTFSVPVETGNLLTTPSGPGQILVADATWIAMGKGRGLFLAVVMDLYTRQILGHAFGTRLDTTLTLNALAQAMQTKHPNATWLHHSDRGSTYVSQSYRGCVMTAGGSLSFTKPGKPQQNGAMESYFKTLKYEEIHRNEYPSPQNLIEAVRHFFEFYNAKRLHSSLGYQAPDQFAKGANL